MRALEEEQVPFALENPMRSDLWELTAVTLRIGRNPAWRVVRVDQGAYGRMAKKANTRIKMTHKTKEQIAIRK